MNSISKPRMWESFFWPTIAAALLLAIWHYSVVFTGTKVFPSPMNVRTGVVELLHKHVLWADIGDSLRRVALGFGAAVVVGIPVGLWLGWSAATYQVVNPTLQILRPISPIAWIPVAIIFFGVGDRAAIFLILNLVEFERSFDYRIVYIDLQIACKFTFINHLRVGLSQRRPPGFAPGALEP